MNLSRQPSKRTSAGNVADNFEAAKVVYGGSQPPQIYGLKVISATRPAPPPHGSGTSTFVS
jgi:hypothetical protein